MKETVGTTNRWHPEVQAGMIAGVRVALVRQLLEVLDLG